MSFEKFVEVGSKEEPRITITKSNSFGFPTVFYRQENIGSFKYVSLYYDKPAGAIALEFHNRSEDKQRFSIVASKGYGGSIIATSFFKKKNIDPKDAHGRYPWTTEVIPEVGKVYVIKSADRGKHMD
jgi:hypothetical protein